MHIDLGPKVFFFSCAARTFANPTVLMIRHRQFASPIPGIPPAYLRTIEKSRCFRGVRSPAPLWTLRGAARDFNDVTDMKLTSAHSNNLELKTCVNAVVIVCIVASSDLTSRCAHSSLFVASGYNICEMVAHNSA